VYFKPSLMPELQTASPVARRDSLLQYPAFDRPVPANGYCWWYIDAVSDDGQNMLTIIAFVGSVFSPYYKWARRSGDADPLNHCSINVVLYGRDANRWCMTERYRGDIQRAPNQFQIGPSALHYASTSENAGTLCIDIDEKSAPLPLAVRGRIAVDVSLQRQHHFSLDTAGQHQWWPAGPNSRINVELSTPALHWNGDAYIDMNWGDCPLEDSINYWCWSRFRTESGTRIFYDVHERKARHASSTEIDGSPDTRHGLSIDNTGNLARLPDTDMVPLPRTRWWRMPRHARRSDGTPQLINTLEDTPFYSRSAIATRLNGTQTTGIHESVSLARFSQPVVQAMLCCRMPRWRAGPARSC
jgi:carotenoid 1,2-hydratase